MNKINTYSAQFKTISEHQSHPNHEIMSENHSNHENQNPKNGLKEKLS